MLAHCIRHIAGKQRTLLTDRQYAIAMDLAAVGAMTRVSRGGTSPGASLGQVNFDTSAAGLMVDCKWRTSQHFQELLARAP